MLGLNLLILALISVNTRASLSLINTPGLPIPENSLFYDFRLEGITLNQIDPDVSLDQPAQDIQSKILSSKQKFLINFTLSGELNFYLAKSKDEVLSEAKLNLDSPLFNISQTLNQDTPGKYSCPISRTYSLSTTKPVSAIDNNIAKWQFIPLGVKLNGRRFEAFSYTGYLSGLNYQDNSPLTQEEIPIELTFSFQLQDAQGVPLSNKAIPLELNCLDEFKSEQINLVSDSQGIINYSLSYNIKVSFSGGSLVKLSSPQDIPRPLYQSRIVDQNQRTHFIWSPSILGAPENPPIIMQWGGGGEGRQRPQPDKRGLPDTGKNLGQNTLDPNNSAGADPINLTLGNVYTQALDIFVPAKGLPIKFERTYNSLEDYNGVLGYGWTHSYNMRITFAGPEDDLEAVVVVMWQDGRRIHFVRDTNGGYQTPKGEYSKLTRNPDGTFILTTKYGQVYNFNILGRLLSLRERNNNQTDLVYDSGGNLITITASGGRKIDLAYDSKNRISSIILPNAGVVKYSYDSDNNLASFTDAGGNLTKYSYAPYHLLEVITDPNSHNRYFSYDWYSRGISFSYDYNNRKVSLSYDEANYKTIITDSLGNKQEYYYQSVDGVELINKIVDSSQNTEEFVWDNNLNRTEIKDKNGFVTRMSYDNQGNLLTVTDPQGNVTAFTYEPRYNLITSSIDALGRTTAFTYDDKGNLKTLTDALGKKSEFIYDAAGQLSKTTNARGFATEFNYNAYGDLSRVTDALGNTTVFEYDQAGNCAKTTDAKGNVTAFTYNYNNQITKVTYPDLTYAAFTYDKAGNRILSRDYSGNETKYEYDVTDKLSKVTDASGGVINYSYDTEGNLISLTDSLENRMLYEYDILNRLIKAINPAGIATEYQYDAAGNRTQRKDGNGNITGFLYDSLNRLTRISYPDASKVEFSYDVLSNRKTMQDKTGITNYAYDTLGRLVSVSGAQANDTITYEYDVVGNRAKMIDQDHKTTLYSYDALNRLKNITDAQGKITTYNYDQVNNLSAVNYPNSTSAAYTYDSLSRLLSLVNKNPSAQPISSYSYTYDTLGRRTKVIMPEAQVSFGYDNLSQLISEVRTGANAYNIAYAYDKSGNRVSRTQNAGKIFYSYNTLNQLFEERKKSAQDTTTVTVTGRVDDSMARVSVQGEPVAVSNGQFQAVNIALNRGVNLITALAEDLAGNKSAHQIQVNVIDPLLRKYTYDLNGNLVKKEEGTQVTSYTYDYENRLAGVSGPLGNAAYVYDGEGKLATQTEAGVTAYFLYDGLDVLIERNAQGQTTASYSRGLSYGGGIGGIISRTTSEGPNYYHYDGSGNVIQLTNATGEVIQSYSYEAFGGLISQSGAVANPYQFSTKRSSPVSGLVDFGFRSYNPVIGRFTTPDPLGMVDGLNRYLYCANNPVNWVDPWGLCKEGQSYNQLPPWALVVGGVTIATPIPGDEVAFWASVGIVVVGNYAVHEFSRYNKKGPLWDAPGMPGDRIRQYEQNQPGAYKPPPNFKNWKDKIIWAAGLLAKLFNNFKGGN